MDEGESEQLVFDQGTLFVRPADAQFSGQFDPRACVGSFAVTASFTVVGGTGAFAGASGGGTQTARGVSVAPRGPEGCSEEEAETFGVARLTGDVRLD